MMWLLHTNKKKNAEHVVQFENIQIQKELNKKLSQRSI